MSDERAEEWEKIVGLDHVTYFFYMIGWADSYDMVSSRTHHRKGGVQTSEVSLMYSIGISSLTRTLGLPHGGKGCGTDKT